LKKFHDFGVETEGILEGTKKKHVVIVTVL